MQIELFHRTTLMPDEGSRLFYCVSKTKEKKKLGTDNMQEFKVFSKNKPQNQVKYLHNLSSCELWGWMIIWQCLRVFCVNIHPTVICWFKTLDMFNFQEHTANIFII